MTVGNVSCIFASERDIPYEINGEMTVEPSDEYKKAGFDFTFKNKSSKGISDFTVVFYLFDENGAPPIVGKNNIVFKVYVPVDGLEEKNICVSLDDFFDKDLDFPYDVDFLYVSHIVYQDKTEWSDPFGLKAY